MKAKLVALGLLLAPVAAAAGPWDDVIAAAKKEGQVVMFTALGGPFQDPAIKSFEEKYGIRVDQIRGRATEIIERIRMEQSTNRFLADVYLTADVGTAEAVRVGAIQSAGDLPALAGIPSARKDWLGVPICLYPYGILINTRLVKPQDEPRSWKDLTDPRWQGKILMDDVRVAGAGSVLFEPTYNAFGREFHEKLAAQKPIITRANREAERRVAQGEYTIYLPQMVPFALILKGLPIKVIAPAEGYVYAAGELTLLRGAPHTNAARLLINHFLEVEAQLSFANAGLIPARPEVIEKANDEARALVSAKLLGTGTAEARARMNEIAATIYK